MLNHKDVLKNAQIIASQRPTADLSVEQYLMTAESLARQVSCLQNVFLDKKVLHIGDDDHLSVLFALYLNCHPVILEYDPRVRKSLRSSFSSFRIQNYSILKYDVREFIPNGVKADTFYINPPYSSKNNGKGVKVWVSRASQAIPIGSTSVLAYPIDETLPWTISCLKEIVDYAYQCGLMIVDINRDIHTYEYLPKDPGLLSSNIYLYKFKECIAPEIEDIDGESLYR